MEEFIMFGKNIADPWNRICFLNDPIILMVDFCQVQGPRPLLWYPLDVCKTHILQEIAIWLMSSENMHGNFSLLYNQRIGVYVLAQYAVMLDVSARALQRPFVIAYISPSKPIDEKILYFQKVITKIILPILHCNRNYIYSALNYASKIVENSDIKNIQSYYSTAGNAQQIIIISNKIKGIVQQLKPWYDRFIQKVYLNEEFTNVCSCGFDEAEFRKFIKIFAGKQPFQLINLLELAPCTGPNCFENLMKTYKNLLRNQVSSVGLIFSDVLPVMRSVFGANTLLEDENDCNTNGDLQVTMNMLTSNYFLAGNENTLRSLSYRLIHCIYPLLAGDKILILASQQRNITGIDLFNKLKKLRICKRRDKIEWIFEQNRINDFTENQLAGFSCDRAKSFELSEQTAKHQFIIIDLNNHRIRCHKYSGRMLQHLYGNRIYPTDKAVMDFVSTIICDIFQLVLLAKHISPETVVNQLGLNIHDQTILYNLLIEFNLIKYIRLKEKIRKIKEKIPIVLQRF